MALPNEPLTRTERYLNRTATGGGTIPDEPLTRVEMYLNKIATGSGDTPEQPLTRMEQYLDYIAENGGGGGTDLANADAYVADFLSTTDLIITTGAVNRYQRYLVGG